MSQIFYKDIGIYKILINNGEAIEEYIDENNEGFGSILEKCKKYEKVYTGEQLEFVKAMKICCESSINYILRYADMAEEIAKTVSTEENKQQMYKIAGACRNISTKPASSFFEAVQLFWLIHELLYTETFPASISMGRFDVYMNPYLENDIEKGIISEEDAEEILEALWVKFSQNLHAYQNITLAGLNMDGTYTANKMTYLILQTSYLMKYDQPLLNIRYHESMPKELWEDCMTLIKTGMGMPAFHNDIEIFKTKRKMGLRTGALPDGKLQGQALANAYSPVQGADHIGPTAVINSAAKSDLTVVGNNAVLDLKFTPVFLDKENHMNALKTLIDTYFDNGGLEIQFNVIDRETLIDAQLHPSKHEDLVVRVSGFSAYFVTLMKATQDEIIARTEYCCI